LVELIFVLFVICAVVTDSGVLGKFNSKFSLVTAFSLLVVFGLDICSLGAGVSVGVTACEACGVVSTGVAV